MLRRITPQRLFLVSFVLLLILVAARAFLVQGWIRPIRIVSGSMATSLLGEHYTIQCSDCGFVFRFGVDSPPPTDFAVCPNCGATKNSVRPESRERGDRVFIDRAPYWLGQPQRFDLVAFRDPRLPARLVVKRVLGLPGELIAIRQGDLYVNGNLLRKSLSDFRQVAILVFDNGKLPREEEKLPARWHADDDHSGWIARNAGFVFSPQATSGSTETSGCDWLTYHHWRCYANTHPRSDEVPVADNYGYNQGESRELREVSDLVLSCTVRIPPQGELALRVHDGRNWCSVRINTQSHQIEVLQADRKLTSVNFSAVGSDAIKLEFGLVDQQIMLGLNGEERIRQSYEPGDSPLAPIAQPISLGGSAAPLEVSNLVVWRDIHYLDPWGVGLPWKMPQAAGRDEYFVLGDNPPLSDDSRRWKNPLLSRNAIIGMVLPLEWSRGDLNP